MRLSGRLFWRVFACALFPGLLSPRTAGAQTPSPWTGVIRAEAAGGFSVVRQRGMSADGRFVVIESDGALVDGDTNGVYDIFVRDRHTGTMQRVSVATDGSEGNAHSLWPAISANGRHVVFQSLASNLGPAGTAGILELYVRDLDTGVTSLVSVGPSGERLCACSPLPVARLSGDGRFVVFSGTFSQGASPQIWMRDRDADQNGVFDEPDGVTTTGIDVGAIEGDLLLAPDYVAISNDARYVAFTAAAFDESGTPLGHRLYLHDRVLATSTRVDRPLQGLSGETPTTLGPDFSDNGQLAYTSSAPDLVADDADAFYDVFVYDIATATNTRLRLTHVSAAFTQAEGAAISADGRFVAFTGIENDGMGTERWNVYAIDRELEASFDISVRTDGSRDDVATGTAMSADGGAIAFNAFGAIIHESLGGGFRVYVATTVSMSSTETDVPMDGGPVPVEIVVPADTFWQAVLVSRTEYGYVQYSSYTGTGPGSLTVQIPGNPTGESMAYELWLGSEMVRFEQKVKPIVQYVSPPWGPASGGTPFQIYGAGFKEGATVTFDGVAATDVVVHEGGFMITGSTPAVSSTSLPAKVVVTNQDGVSSREDIWFLFYDDTPPVVTATVTGTAGANGWYTSDVVVQWNVEEKESELSSPPCGAVALTTDVASRVVSCTANSNGGGTTAEVVINRDATPPTVAIAQPQAVTYLQGQAVAIAYTCSDATSGIASCTASQSGNLDTSTPGAFSFVATAVDHAGHVSHASVTYTVQPGKVNTSLTLVSSPNPSHPNQDVTLTATVAAAGGSGLPTGLVELRINGALVGSAPLVNGVATGTVKGKKKGTYSLAATYPGDANFNGSSATLLHQVN